MATVPDLFRKSPDPTINSYSASDIVTGHGNVQLNGFVASISGSILYGLTTASPYVDTANSYYTVGSFTNSNFALAGTLTLDTDYFKQPKVVEGTAILQFSDAMGGSSGSAGNVYFDCFLYKYNGVVETLLGRVTSTTHTGLPATSQTFILPITIANATTIEPENLVRLKIDVWARRNGAGTISPSIFLDPNNQDATNPITVDSAINHTSFILDLPVKIEV